MDNRRIYGTKQEFATHKTNLKGTRRDLLSAHTWFRRSIQLNAAGRYAAARAAANRALEILAAMPGHILGRVIDQVARTAAGDSAAEAHGVRSTTAKRTGKRDR